MRRPIAVTTNGAVAADSFKTCPVRIDSLAPAAQRVARYIDQNKAAVLASSASEIGTITGTSDATVVRAVQALGFGGLNDLKQALVKSIDKPSQQVEDMRRTLDEVGRSASRAADAVLEAHEEALARIRTPVFRERLVAAVAALHPVERVISFGIGPSAALAGYVSTLLVRGGRSAVTLDRTGISLADQLLTLRTGDAVLVLAYGTAYREVTAVFNEARRLCLPLIHVTDDADGRLARRADVVLPVPRGRTGRVALHGATMVALEALVLGLVALDGEAAVTALDRLASLRRAVSGGPANPA